MRAALYFRAGNKADGHDQTPEPENQFVRLREFATALGWTIAAEFSDRQSCAKADRSQFQAMMAAAARGDFDVALVWSLDRFSGERIYKTLLHLNTLAGYGVAFRSFSETFIDTTGRSGGRRRRLHLRSRPNGSGCDSS